VDLAVLGAARWQRVALAVLESAESRIHFRNTQMNQKEGQGRSGIATVRLECEKPELVSVYGLPIREAALLLPDRVKFFRSGEIDVKGPNSYVNTGLNNALDREWGLGGTAIGYIGVSSDNSAVTAATVYLAGASAGTPSNTIILALSPAATRSAQTTTGGATFTNSSFTSGVFAINKLGLLNTSTDAGTGLIDVIGGSGGSSPYTKTFSLNLTSAGTFSFTAQVAVTAVAV